MRTSQEDRWAGDFGLAYTGRNMSSPNDMDHKERALYGESRTQIYKSFFWGKEPFGVVPRDSCILEVGCNIGNPMQTLLKLGYYKVKGIDIQDEALKIAKIRGLLAIKASALDLPFQDKEFDLVYTSGLLIHLNPSDGSLCRALSEINRVSKKWFWGFESYSDRIREIPSYHGEKELYWTADYQSIFQMLCPDFKLVQSKMYPYQDNSGFREKAFLLEKKVG